MVSRSFSITGQNHCAQTLVTQFLKDLTSLWSHIVPTNDSPKKTSFGKPDFGEPGLCWSDPGDGVAMLRLALREPVPTAKRADLAIATGEQTLPGNRFEARAFECFQALLLPIAGYSPREWMGR